MKRNWLSCRSGLIVSILVSAVFFVLFSKERVFAATSISYLPFDGPGVPYFQPVSQGGSIYPDWYQATGEGGPFTASIDTSKKITGAASLKMHLTSGIGLYAQFNPYSDNGRQFARNYMDIPSGWQFGIYNRMSFWFFHAANSSPLYGAGGTNYYMGTYVKSVVINDTSSDENGGGHFYHPFNVESGVWSYCVMNTHPGHQRGDPGSLDSGDRLYPTTSAYGGSGDPASTYTYYDTLTRWYISGDGGSNFPQDYWLDDVKIYQEPVVENDNLVYSICSSYNQPINKLTLTWNRYKGVDTSHEVRYAFSDIHTLGWNNATLAPNGTVDSTGNDYNGMVYTTTAINVGSNPTIYFAIKPQGETLFSQIALRLITNTPDTTPPSSPTNLAANATSQSSITISWTASTDDIGVTDYQVERCTGLSCTTFTQVGTAQNSPYIDASLTASTGYSYHVRAVDAAGNTSGWSNVVGATTQAPDTQAPTTPTNLQAATPPTGGSSTINLTWTASTDNVGVTQYNVERCSGASCTTFAQVGTSTTNSYSDTGLTASTLYRYQVRATDGAGNNSNYSSISQATTQVAPPVSYLQGAATTDTTTASFLGNNTAGNTIIAAISWGNNASASCSDSQGNTYAIATTAYDATNNQSLGICYATNIKAGANTFTLNAGGASSTRILIHEYSGIASTNPIDVTKTNIATATTAANNVTSTTATTTHNNDLVFGAVMDDTGTTTITAGTNFTQRQSVNNKDLVSQDQIQSNAGSIASTQTFGTAHRYLAQMVAFNTIQQTSTPTSCSTVTPTNFTTSTYNSYGAPFDAFQTSTNLMDAKCTTADTHTINLTTGITGDTTRIVYTKGYWYDSTASSWTQYSGTCTGALNGEWCQGSVSSTITSPNLSTASASNPTYVVGMTCSVQGGSWKCGCRDTACANFSWQVQGAGQ